MRDGAPAMADAALALMINVVPFVVRNDGYRRGQGRLVVSNLRLSSSVEAYCGEKDLACRSRLDRITSPALCLR